MRTEEEKQQFEINLKDLWYFERRSFEKKGLPLDFCEEVLEKMSSIVIQRTIPFVEKQTEGGKHWTYWESKLSEYSHSLEKENPFYSDLIYTGKAFYTYNSDVSVKSNQEDFHLWFALMFRQFDHQLIELPKFLEYHLSESFNSDLTKYTRFVTLVIRQFKEEVLSEKVILTVNEWFEYYSPNVVNLNPVSKTKSLKVERTISGKYESFLFDSRNEKLTEFEGDSNNWAELILSLSKSRFIAKETKVKTLKKVFKNVGIHPTQKIVWKGSNKELQWFVKYFVYEKSLVETPGDDIWLITMKCFNKSDGSEYSINMLSNASGNNLKRKELLYSILNESFG